MEKVREIVGNSVTEDEMRCVEYKQEDPGIQLESMFGNGSAMFCYQRCCYGTIGGFAVVQNVSDRTPAFKVPAVLTCKHNVKHYMNPETDFVYIKDGIDDRGAPSFKEVGKDLRISQKHDFMLVLLDKEFNQDNASEIDAKFLSPDGSELPTLLYRADDAPVGLVQKLGCTSGFTKGKVRRMASLPDKGVKNAYEIEAAEGYAHFSNGGDSGSLVTCSIEEGTKEVVVYGMVFAGRTSEGKKLSSGVNPAVS